MKREFSVPDWFFFSLLIILSLAFFKIISYFLLDIILAAILTHLFRGHYEWLVNKLNFSKGAAALSCMFSTIFLIILPTFFIGAILSAQAATTYSLIRTKWPEIQFVLSMDFLYHLKNQLPFLDSFTEAIKTIDLGQQVTNVLSNGTEFMVNLVQQTFVNITLKFFHLVIMLFCMFFLLLDADKLMQRIYALSPLRDQDEAALLQEIIKISDATLLGTVIIGLIEGAIGGTIFAIFHIAAPLFWGVVMMIFSMIPIIGINSILIPTGIILILSGRFFSGITTILLSYGATTVTQNYLKPYLVGKRGGLHPAIVLLSTVGGIAWLGLIGFLIGPMIAALFIAIWNQFGQHYQEELAVWNGPPVKSRRSKK